MQYRSGKEIRSQFIDFWASKGCHHYKSFSLIPHDPSLLFTIAGMVPFKKYYLGLEEPEFKSAVTSQKCLRTNDIENVGHTARHHTFFEMLGNFSWGGYFKRESLTWGWEFLTDIIGLDGSRMYATIFKDDEEAFNVWTKDIGMAEDHIVRCGEDENFWYMGPQGPCGPDSEILYDQGVEYSCGPDCHPGCSCDRFLEIWNHVFTQYDRQADGRYKDLPRKNIDTGMGLERLTSLVQGVHNDFETDLFTPLMKAVGDIAGVKYGDGPMSDLALKVISDHLRSVCFMIADGILPTNDGRGYVLRRLLRRASRYGRLIGINTPFLTKLIPTVIKEMGNPYGELIENRLTIEQVVDVEESRFSKTVVQGSELLQQEIASAKAAQSKELSGAVAFQLYDTYGFPLELTKEICQEQGLGIDEKGFQTEMNSQRDRARSTSRQVNVVIKGSVYNDLFNQFGATPFLGYETNQSDAVVLALVDGDKRVDSLSEGHDGVVLLDRTPFYAERGGEVGDTGTITAGELSAIVKDSIHPVGDLNIQKVTVTKGTLSVGQKVHASVDGDRRNAIARNHTATHLLHQALIHVLGGHVRQNGSLVSDKFLRFDYTHFAPLTPDQTLEVEQLVNQIVVANLPVTTIETDLETAKASGAKALFEEKYGDRVRVVSVGKFSKELCGGVHVHASGDIGMVMILNDESIGSGVRRITAITGLNTLDAIQLMRGQMVALSEKLGVKPARFVERIASMELENRDLKTQLEKITRRSLSSKIDSLLHRIELPGGQAVLYTGRVDGQDPELLREMGDKIKSNDPKAVLLFMSKVDEAKVQVLCMLGDAAEKAKLHAGKIVKEIAMLVGGSGGGRPNMAQAGGKDTSKIDDALSQAKAIVSKFLKV